MLGFELPHRQLSILHTQAATESWVLVQDTAGKISSTSFSISLTLFLNLSGASNLFHSKIIFGPIKKQWSGSSLQVFKSLQHNLPAAVGSGAVKQPLTAFSWLFLSLGRELLLFKLILHPKQLPGSLKVPWGGALLCSSRQPHQGTKGCSCQRWHHHPPQPSTFPL